MKMRCVDVVDFTAAADMMRRGGKVDAEEKERTATRLSFEVNELRFHYKCSA
jgi:hypothetical protein